MREILTDEIQTELNHLTSTKTEDVIYCVYNKPIVFRSMNKDVNVEYCNNNDITIIDTGNMGGTMVANTGDMGLAILKKDGWDIGREIITLLCENYKDSIPNLRVDGNDLIAEDNFKLASFASFNVGDKIIYTIVAISLNPNIEHIVNICSKPMKKIPKGLIEYGISIQQIKSLLFTFVHTYGK